MSRRLAFGFAALLASTPGESAGSPHPVYGGVLRLQTRSTVDAPPCPGRSVADWVLAFNGLEPLYRADEDRLEPVLAAGPPSLADGELTVPIRPDLVDHDGEPVGPAEVAAWLARAADAGCTLLPRAATATVGVQGDAIVLPWPSDLEAAAQTLSDPALRWFRERDGRLVGTGPFRRTPGRRRDRRLEAWLGHREGRPLLDAVVFVGPDEAPAGPLDARVKTGPEGALDRVWYLAVGPELAEDPADLARELDQTLDRVRLLGRFGPGPMRPEPPAPRSGPRARLPAGPVSLTVPRSFPGDFVERLQLGLLRRGVRVVIERVTPAELDARRASGRFALLLDVLVEPRGPDGSRAHARLSALFGDGEAPLRSVREDEPPASRLGVVILARGRTGPHPERPSAPSASEWRSLADVWKAPAAP